MDGERLAQIVAQKAQQDPRVAKIVADARAFDELQEQPGWRQLRDYVVSKEEGWLKELAKRLSRPKAVAADHQREIDYYRGFYDGAKYVVLIPEVCLENLQTVARKAWALEASEETEDQEWSPYL